MDNKDDINPAPQMNGNGQQEQSKLFIVGIGASAGGIEALQEFFRNVPEGSGLAYVVILHLSPNHESMLGKVLQAVTPLQVIQVKDKEKVLPGHVYVVPANQHLEMLDGHIYASVNTEVEDRRAPVDIFFRTLAETHGPRAIAVILSGTGANGSMGIKRIKEKGGAAFVQNPREADYNEMPRNSIATELIDYVLPVAEMPGKIAAYVESQGKVDIPADTEERHEEVKQALREVFTFLRIRTGHDFSNYKRPTLLRRIERRINIRNQQNLPAYAAYMRENPEETQALLKDLLISVTNFFRDQKAFEYLEKEIIPGIVRSKQLGDSLRVWVAGCATGEEAYTMAMLWTEATFGIIDAPKIQIFATDIDETAISQAREGLYTINDAADVSPERLHRFFIMEGEQYRVRREIREMVLFAVHNMIKDPPFSHLDMVTCRNVMIYLNHTAQKRLMESFHFALSNGGTLFLGGSESVDGAADLYTLVSREFHIYQSRQVAARIYPVMESLPAYSSEYGRSIDAVLEVEKKTPGRINYGDLHQRLLEQYAPPSVVVNEEYNIVHISESAGIYMEVSGGEPSRNLLKLVKPEIRLELRTALYQAVHQQTNTEARNLKVSVNNQVHTLNVQVRPVLQSKDLAQGFLLILFQENIPAPADVTPVLLSEVPLVNQLEDDLARIRMQLRTTSEQHDMQSEELKASNEEFQALNEELRSAAEELETSKEELHSINEELTTVNQELKVKVEETTLVSNNLLNFMNSTDIGTIFLNRSLRVNLFTPAIQQIFNLITSDPGRPLSDITHKLEYTNLLQDAQMVLDKLQNIEREVRTTDNRIYLMRLLPYRTADDRILGVVITFFNLTAYKKMEEALHGSEERFRALVLASSDVLYQMNADWSEMLYLKGMGFLADTTVSNGHWLSEYIPPDARLQVLNTIRKAIDSSSIFEMEHPVYQTDGNTGWVSSRAVPVLNAKGEVTVWFGAAGNISERKRAEEALHRSKELQAFLLTLSDSLRNLTGPEEIKGQSSRLLGEQLQADWSYYTEYSKDGLTAKITHEYEENGIQVLKGNYSLDESREYVRTLQSGQGILIEDCKNDTLYAGIEILAGRFADMRSAVIMPVVRNGQLLSSMTVLKQQPHSWTPLEVSLVEKTAELAWTAVEHARSVKEIRLSEEKYRTLFEMVPVAVVLCDATGVIREANRLAGALWGRYPDKGSNAERYSGVHKIYDSSGKIIAHDESPVARILRGEKLLPADMEFSIERPDGTRREVVSTIELLRSSEGTIFGAINCMYDITEQKKAKTSEQQIETQFRILADAIPQLIWTNDGNGVANYFNQRWYDYSGLSFEASSGKGWEAIVHPDDATVSKEYWHKALASSETFDTEFRLRRADGVYRWHIGRNVPLLNDKKEVLGWFGSATDVEDLKTAQESLRESKERLRVTMESITEYAVITLDAEGKIQGWNSGASRTFGYTEEEATGKPVSMIFTPEDRVANASESEMRIARKEGRAPDERWHQRKDGSRFYMSGVMWPVYKGALSGYVKVSRDMTAQKHAEEVLLISEERYRIALQAAGMGAWDWNVAENTITWNEQHYVMFGLKKGDGLTNLDFFMRFVYPEDADMVRKQMEEAVEKTGTFNAEYRIIRADNGAVRWMNDYGRAVTSEAGKALRIVGVMSDITERKALEQQKEEFIGIASHELKTPVTSIKAYAEMLRSMFVETDDIVSAQLMEKLDIQVDRLTGLIRDLLDTTKVTGGQLDLYPEKFYLNELISERVEDMQRISPNHRLVTVPRDIALVTADRDRVGQVLTNLLSNAIKYSPAGGDVTIICETVPNAVKVSVRDRGIGIAEDLKDKVFERFYRIADPSVQTYPGMGLGLYITAGIIQRHGGKIWVESQPGRGSVFYFTLPYNN